MKCFISWLVAVGAVSSGFAAEPAPTTWMVDGIQREALVYLPSRSSNSKPPVIFAFHGHGGNMHFATCGVAFVSRLGWTGKS
jgi:polyhydroxybutyrate depolymerase